jgi:5'-nucleotidase
MTSVTGPGDMRVLITNDDGIDSAGLVALAAAAVDLGLDVVVAAPHHDRSGTSASLTILEEDGRLAVHPRRLPDLAVDAYAVEATPAFIAMAAVDGAFGDPPDLVASGINHGPNAGQAVLHSGTVGAALTAQALGTPAVAFSAMATRPRHLRTSAAVARSVLGWVIDDLGVLDSAVLNVNVPDIELESLKGLRAASLASFGAVEGRVGERGEGFVTMTLEEVDTAPEPGTDAALLADGWATVTLVRRPSAAPAPSVPVHVLDRLVVPPGVGS